MTIDTKHTTLGPFNLQLPDGETTETSDHGLRVVAPAPDLLMMTAALLDGEPTQHRIMEIIGGLEHDLRSAGPVERRRLEDVELPGVAAAAVFEWEWGTRVRERLIMLLAFAPSGGCLQLKINFPASEASRYESAVEALVQSVTCASS